jgi:AraC-like DNA-binding protein
MRTPKLIRRSDPGLCKIDVLVSGRIVVEQEGREADLRPGDFAFVDLSRPCRWSGSSYARCVAVTFPRALLALRRAELARLTGVRIPGDHGTGALVSSIARQLPRHVADDATAEGARLGTTVVDLLTVALAGRLDRAAAVPHSSMQQALLTRIHAFIEQRLSDPELSPTTIAAAHHISVRYLYKLFEPQQTTVAEWIRRRRLERCRRDLLDPTLRAQPVSAIAARWGLTNAAHFNRLFRVAFDAPPGEYRRNGRVS